MTAARHPLAGPFNTPELRASATERERARTALRAAFLAAYGDERAAWADTPMEGALRAACEPLTDPEEASRGLCRLASWDWCSSLDDMPPELRAAVSKAWPLPATVEGAWAEFQATEARTADRQAFSEDFTPATFTEARQRVVQGLLDNLPAQSPADLRARISWLEHLNELGAPRIEVQRERLATLRADVERLVGDT